MRTQGLFALAFMLMLPFTAFAADATSAPPGVTMAPATGMVPTPPVCNASTQKLYWNGSGWQCIGVGTASGYAKGSVVGGVRTTSSSYGVANLSCPGGTFGSEISKGQTFTRSWTHKYICIKN